MHRFLLAAPALALAILPAVGRAQDLPAVPRPTPAEVAAAVVACIEATTGQSFYLTAGWDRATLLDGDSPAITFTRTPPGLRQGGPREYTIPEDPARPPVVMAAWSNALAEAPPPTPEVVACFEQEYRHLLRP